MAGILSANAQTARQDVAAQFARSASNHYAYPAPTRALTPAPEGYEAFYISHYGRHGSRWLSSEGAYTRPVAQLEHANREGMLTEQGKHLLYILRDVAAAAHDRAGDLSDIGAQQHRDIATRMFNNFPSVFGGKAVVTARSSMKIRCILSMQNETMTLRALNPDIRITTDASASDMGRLAYGYGEDTLANKLRARMNLITDSMYRHNIKPQRFVDQLIDNAPSLEWLDGLQLMRDVFDIAGNMQSHRRFSDIDLFHLFTVNEIFELWRIKNACWYTQFGNAPHNGNRMPFTKRNLLREMIDSTDIAIANGQRGANLRFGHESILLPLASLMELDTLNYSCDDLDQLHLHWQDYNIIPKACNIQMVFYRPVGQSKAKADDIFVKVLFNEHEAMLPVGTDMFPYYSWAQLRQYYLEKINTDINWDD